MTSMQRSRHRSGTADPTAAATGASGTSVLVITPAPDERDSTLNLMDLVEELEQRPNHVELWYLRTGNLSPRRGSRVVDSLRTWPPCRALDAVGLRTPAAWIRGRRLRRWLRRAAPDVVVLDDGLGERVIETLRPRPAVVVRLNDEPTEHLHMEQGPPLGRADLWIIPPTLGSERGTTDTPCSIEYGFRRPFRIDIGRRFADEGVRREARLGNDLPSDAPLVTGWGDDGWLDGPDLFIRTLWALEQRHGVRAHGAWFGLTADPHEVDRLRDEARRCGVSSRYHHRPNDTVAGRLCGDAVLLPYRSDASEDDAFEAACSGAVVVAFEAAAISDPAVSTVRDLDVEQAAAEIARGLDESRAQRSVDTRRRLEPGPLVDDIVALACLR